MTRPNLLLTFLLTDITRGNIPPFVRLLATMYQTRILAKQRHILVEGNYSSWSEYDGNTTRIQWSICRTELDWLNGDTSENRELTKPTRFDGTHAKPGQTDAGGHFWCIRLLFQISRWAQVGAYAGPISPFYSTAQLSSTLCSSLEFLHYCTYSRQVAITRSFCQVHDHHRLN